jgi:hypothetical protein
MSAGKVMSDELETIDDAALDCVSGGRKISGPVDFTPFIQAIAGLKDAVTAAAQNMAQSGQQGMQEMMQLLQQKMQSGGGGGPPGPPRR